MASLGVHGHEELLEICEQFIDILWSVHLSEDYRSATSLFLSVCVSHFYNKAMCLLLSRQNSWKTGKWSDCVFE